MIDEPVVNLSESVMKPNCGVDSRDRTRGECFQRKIAVGHAVEGVRHGAVEAKRFGCRVAVDRERRTGKGCRAERALVQAAAGVLHAAAVAGEHLDIGEQMMAEGDRLGRLEVGKARHDRARMRQRLGGERGLQPGERDIETIEAVADVKAEIGGDLVVARARRMEAAGRFAGDGFQAAFDVHVNVFQRALELEGAALDLGEDRVKASQDRRAV
jgi:hypothetical protein